MRRNPAVRTRLGNRRGSALVLVLLLTVTIAALATSAIFLTSNAGTLTRLYDREREFRYAAEAALAIGKSRLSKDTSLALADSGYTTLLSSSAITGADGQALPGILVNLYGGRTGSTTGQFGLYASLVAEARDNSGARYVRRLELAEENFARFLDWSHTTIGGCYAKGEYMWGPVWSNARIDVCGGSYAGAEFRGDVGTASYIRWPSNGVFFKGYKEYQTPINLPSTARLSRLPAYAAGASFNFTAPTSGPASTARLRIEFVPVDLNNDNDTTDPEEGFFRVFSANNAAELRADYLGQVPNDQCGDWHWEGGRLKFFPVSVHDDAWFNISMSQSANLTANGWTVAQKDAHRSASRLTIMQQNDARCYPAGDPHLVAIERPSSGYSSADRQKGGEDTTFTASTTRGNWLAWPGAIPANFPASRRASEGRYMFPMFRGYNPGAKGVIYVAGTVAVSGVLRGRITLYASDDITFIDDLTYSADPSSDQCRDMLGVIAGDNVTGSVRNVV